MSEYTYTKSPIALDRLTQEIQQSVITVALDHINLLGEALSIFFKSDLSNDEISVLNGIVDGHSGELLEQNQLVSVRISEDIVNPKDIDGSILSRIKVTKLGWQFQLHGIEFETSVLNSIYEKDSNLQDYNYSALKFYELIDNVETLMVNPTQNDLDTKCVKTVLDFEPTHNYEIIGGFFKQTELPTSDVRFWCVGVPDVPAQYGGSKEFATGSINLKYAGLEEGISIDGRAPKYLAYSATYHTNKLIFILRHSTGFKHKMNIWLEYFKA